MSLTKMTEGKMKDTIEHLKEDLKHIRTGRADPHILNNIQVEVYGTQMRLPDTATVSVPESRQLLIAPFDANNTSAIKKGIEMANIGLQPIVDGNIIRINIPTMDESLRKNMVKQAKKKGEEAKVSIRNARRDGNEALKKQKNTQEITEDIQKRSENDIQKLTDNFCKNIDELISQKEKDIIVI